MYNRRRVIQLALPLLLVTVASGQNFDLSWYTVDGGGVMFSTGVDFELSGTIGQPDAGVMAGGDFELTGGFWFGIALGDCNVDGGVNLFDFDTLQPCMSGPDGAPLIPECTCFDLDADDDVDLQDVAEFQRSFSGS